MKVGIVSDHRGYDLKNQIKEKLKNEYEFLDYGTNSIESVDYPDYAFILGDKINNNEVNFGIAICGSGIGISIACNKVKNIRCAKISTKEEAFYTRNDNDANVLALSSKTDIKEAEEIIKTFIETKFSGEERHKNRIQKIMEYEDQHAR